MDRWGAGDRRATLSLRRSAPRGSLLGAVVLAQCSSPRFNRPCGSGLNGQSLDTQGLRGPRTGRENELVDWLKAERHHGMFVLRGKQESKLLHPSSLSHAFRKMADAEGWDAAITLYSCRHTYATELLRAGVDLRTVQARMGHESARTTQQYLYALDVEARPTDRLPS